MNQQFAIGLGIAGAAALGAGTYYASKTDIGNIALDPVRGVKETGSPAATFGSAAIWIGAPALLGFSVWHMTAARGPFEAIAYLGFGAMVAGAYLSSKTD